MINWFAVAAGGKQQAGGPGSDVFDVRVVAFAGGSARTLQALQELFGLDRAAAQRLIESVPTIVRRAAPANEARDYVDALRGIGAEVSLERPANTNGSERSVLAKPPPPPAVRRAPPPPPRAAPPPPRTKVAKAPPPPPRDEALPKPIMRAPTADLEFDLADGDGRSSPEPMRSGDDSRGEPKSGQAIGAASGKRARSVIEFDEGGGAGKLELDVEPARGTIDKPASPSAGADDAASRRTLTGAVSLEPPVSPRMAAQTSRGPGPMSRAAVVVKTGPTAAFEGRRRRQIAVLRMLGAILIAATGFWLDSSIIHGTANLSSVLVHAFAIYQLGVGLRGMVA